MSVRYNVVMSDDLDLAVNKAASEAETTKAEIFRKALQLYLAVRDGKRRGMKVGLVDSASDTLQTEFVGL